MERGVVGQKIIIYSLLTEQESKSRREEENKRRKEEEKKRRREEEKKRRREEEKKRRRDSRPIVFHTLRLTDWDVLLHAWHRSS
jgi:hypothetical protein